jgi:hypothetical protein
VYQVNVGGRSIQTNAKPGDFVGGTTARTRLLGVAFSLEGSDAKKYDIEYSVRFEKETEAVKGKNGGFCGVIGKTGKAIQAFNVVIKPK